MLIYGSQSIVCTVRYDRFPSYITYIESETEVLSRFLSGGQLPQLGGGSVQIDPS